MPANRDIGCRAAERPGERFGVRYARRSSSCWAGYPAEAGVRGRIFGPSGYPAGGRGGEERSGFVVCFDFAAAAPVLHGADVVGVLEALAEMTQGAESQLIADVGHVELAVVEQHVGGTAQLYRHDELRRGLSRNGFELHEEFGARHAHLLGELVDAEFRIADVGLDYGHCAVEELAVEFAVHQILGFDMLLAAELLAKDYAAVD